MSATSRIRHEFVELIPSTLHEGVVYVSIPYATAAHRCCCGCGNEVVTPITPTDWSLRFDGENISLDPSIGNWALPCRSHYWIVGNQVRWGEQWTSAEVEKGRAGDRLAKSIYYARDERHSTKQTFSRRSAHLATTGAWADCIKHFVARRLGLEKDGSS